jgi:DNA polymerase-3 subunit alpha
LFGARKNGREAIEYPHALLEDVLKETYGIFVYQEQVMEAAKVLAGYSLGEADLLRRAMGKKIQPRWTRSASASSPLRRQRHRTPQGQ